MAELQCSVPGECIHSDLIRPEVVNNEKECLSNCKAEANCKWYTHNKNTTTCMLLENCKELSTEECDICVSGEKGCDLYQCGIQGSCQVRHKIFCAN